MTADDKLQKVIDKRGVIYWIAGSKCLSRLWVSIASLRRVYPDVRIWVVLDNATVPKDFVGPFQAISETGAGKTWWSFAHLHLKKQDNGKYPPNWALLEKCRIHLRTPFESTVFLDADTMVLKPFHELWEWAEEYEFTSCAFANWKSDGKVKGRIQRYEKVCPELLPKAYALGPAINTGVFAWRKGATIFEGTDTLPSMFALAESNRETRIPDEIAAQILMAHYPCKIAPQKFNHTCNKLPLDPDCRVLHFHGRKHMHLDKTKRTGAAVIWSDFFMELIEEDWCGLREVVGRWGPGAATKEGKDGKPDNARADVRECVLSLQKEWRGK